jgi:hypothetical protein
MSKKPGKDTSASRTDRVIIRAKRGTVTRLKLVGPTTLQEGRALAARVNSIIAHSNTLYFKTPAGEEILPKISSRTERDT